MRKKLSKVVLAVFAFALIVGTSTRADAAFIASICNDLACMGGDDLLVLDNGAGDTIAGTGAISFATSAYGYSLLVNTSQSKPMLGSATAPQLDLTFSVTTSGSATSPVFLYASDTDFVGASAHGFLLTMGGTNSGDSGTVTGRAWGGTSNTAMQFSGANLFGNTGALSGPVFSGSVSGSYTSVVSPYSLTIGVAINRTTPGTTTGDLNLSPVAVPEPASMLLLGMGLAGVASRRRNRRQAK